MKTLKLFSLFVFAGTVFLSCQRDEMEVGSDYGNKYATKSAKTEAVDNRCITSCIDPENADWSEITDQQVVSWGGPAGNRYSKTVDIVYYNTLETFVVKVMSTEDIANLLVDGVSVKEFSNPLPAGTWYEFTLPLPDDWEVCDDYSFGFSVIGNGPQAVFDVAYQLVGKCAETDVFNPATGKIWMDRNLGASRVATSSTDEEAYGDLYQWGRAADGHQLRTSGITSTLSSSDTPGHGNFILAPISPFDWRSPMNNNLWQGVNGVNNPCPTGYRLPTAAELDAERLSWSSIDSDGAFGSPLKLPMAGYRGSSNGSLTSVGSYGYYWSSTVDDPISPRSLTFNSTTGNISFSFRAIGNSVRCIKN
jgi:uncharacterized protein (TIGR02145 family)